MLPVERRPSGGFGLALLTMGHAVGWPFARGGSCRLAEALEAKLQELGGEIHVSSPVDELPRADVVLADVSPRELARICGERLPDGYRRRRRPYRHGPGAFKVDWRPHGPIPWTAQAWRRAGPDHPARARGRVASSVS